jgi:peptidoglycan/LPS O-acetylase OafA/YrhL
VERGLSSPRESIEQFYVRRTARIFPPYYLLLIGFAFASMLTSIENFSKLEQLAYFLYGTNILVAVRNHWIGDFGHLWSLAVEEQFYLLFAPLLLLVPRRLTMGVCLAMVSVGIATQIALQIRHASGISVYANSFVNFALLGFGGVIGLSASRPAPKWLSNGAAQISLLLLYLALPAAFGTWPTVWPTLGRLSTVLVGVLLFQIFNGQLTWFVTVLESSPLRRLGRISYGAYLIHPFIHFQIAEEALSYFNLQISASRPAQVLSELAVTLILAAISWRCLEKPIIGWAARVTSRRSGRSASAATPSQTAASPP